VDLIPVPSGLSAYLLLNPLRGQEECRKQAGIGHWGRWAMHMNRASIDEFAELTRRQLHGDPSATGRIAMMNPTISDGYCLYNAYEQWKGAFSFHPGRAEALPVIASIAEKISAYTSPRTLGNRNIAALRCRW